MSQAAFFMFPIIHKSNGLRFRWGLQQGEGNAPKMLRGLPYGVGGTVCSRHDDPRFVG